MARKYGLYVNGQYVHTKAWKPVPKSTHPAELLGEMAFFDSAHDDPELLDAALEGVSQTFHQIMHQGFFPLEERLAFLARLKLRLEDQKENFAQLMMNEVAKPIALCRAEVDRAIYTIHWTLEEARALLSDQPLPFEGREGWKIFSGVAVREARGPLLALSPFNFPLNLVMHKLAPAIACGCPVLLKPSPKAALTALCLVDYCHAEGLP
ncbi:MAG: aldehyde dehydrogenase family protein, partial [Bdellovibrionota bacterium]